jgi:hypothetical protein
MTLSWAGNITVAPDDMDEQLVPLFLGPNEWFWGIVGLLGVYLLHFVTRCPRTETYGTDRIVTRTKAGSLIVKATIFYSVLLRRDDLKYDREHRPHI